MADLSRAIKADPAFVGRLIKAANTGDCGGRRAVVSVQDALTVLGLPAVRTLALGFSLLSLHRSGACRSFDYQGFWSVSLASAIALQAMARQTRCAQPEEAFCLGLLARIGELALATLYPEDYSRVLVQVSAEPGHALIEIERNAFAMDHNELTAAMLADWGLPKPFCDAAYHAEERGDSAFPEGSRPWLLVQALAIAQQAASICVAAEHDRSSLMPRLFLLGSRLEIDTETLSAICDQVTQSWREWGGLLDLATCEVPSFEELARTANEAALLPAPETGATMWGEVYGGASPGRLRVLVADDDASIRELLRSMLEQAGHEVFLATNGREALEAALGNQTHLLIAGWRMPEMDGMELIRTLRQTKVGRGMYVLVVTSMNEEDTLVEAFDNGADDVMSKPLNPRVLAARLRAGQRVIRLQQEIERDREEMRRFAAELAVTNRRLNDAALTDALTGFANRRYAMDRMSEEWSVAKRYQRPLSCMMIDIDEFKRINDTYGHDIGDLVLRQVSASLKESLRTQDVVARMGGDEFIVICPDTNLSQVLVCAERARNRVSSATIRSGMLRLRISVSIGVAEVGIEMNGSDALVKVADQGLYVAKQRGRNRVAAVQAGPNCVARSDSAAQG